MPRGKKNWNHVRISTLEPGLWHDRDNVLLHASFQILVDFVEGEKPFKYIDWTTNREHKRARREIARLYYWWKRAYPARKEPAYGYDVNPVFDKFADPDGKIHAAWKKYCNELYRLETAWEAEDQNMLVRLVRVRKYLWT